MYYAFFGLFVYELLFLICVTGVWLFAGYVCLLLDFSCWGAIPGFVLRVLDTLFESPELLHFVIVFWLCDFSIAYLVVSWFL